MMYKLYTVNSVASSLIEVSILETVNQWYLIHILSKTNCLIELQ